VAAGVARVPPSLPPRSDERYSTVSAVIADVVESSVVDDGLVVNVVNVRDVHVIHRAVVVEGSVIQYPP